jgi:hypothetical protein
MRSSCTLPPSVIRIIKSRRIIKGIKRNAYRILMGKPVGKRPLGRTRLRWVDNIKMDLRRKICTPLSVNAFVILVTQ